MLLDLKATNDNDFVHHCTVYFLLIAGQGLSLKDIQMPEKQPTRTPFCTKFVYGIAQNFNMNTVF